MDQPRQSLHPRRPEPSAHTFVTDFDGTMTEFDFYRLAVDRLLPAGGPDYWSQYRDKRITHFEALQAIFRRLRAGAPELEELIRDMNLDPALPETLRRLRAGGWRVVVASAGCDWYIRRLLAGMEDGLEIQANPGRIGPHGGLHMERPATSRYASHELGVDKALIVRDALAAGGDVAFAGDGFPDVEAALLVPEHRRFAKADLARTLEQEGLRFQRYERWSEIAGLLGVT